MGAYKHIVTILGEITTALIPVASVHTFWMIIKNKSTRGLSPLPFITTLIEHMLRIYYGIARSRTLRDQLVYCWVCACELAYVVIFLIYSPRRKMIRTMSISAGFLAFFGIVVLVCENLAQTPRRRTLGVISSLFSVIMYGAPLIELKKAISTRTVESIPLPLSVSLFFSATAQSLAGKEEWDGFVWIPPTIGTLLGFIQIVFFFVILCRSHVTRTGSPSPTPTEYETAPSSLTTADYETASSSLSPPVFPPHEEIEEVVTDSSMPSLEEVETV